jgi:hypothetical protein
MTTTTKSTSICIIGCPACGWSHHDFELSRIGECPRCGRSEVDLSVRWISDPHPADIARACRDSGRPDYAAIAAEERAFAEREADRQAEIEDAMSLVRAVAEVWAPGRVSVRRTRSGEILVGRWNAPFAPGHGTPAEVRRAMFRDGEVELEPTSYAGLGW